MDEDAMANNANGDDDRDERPEQVPAAPDAAEMDDEREVPAQERAVTRAPAADRTQAGGFFTIYKRGQGYWTRMGTAAGAALVGVLTVAFLYQYLPPWIKGAFVPADIADQPAAVATSIQAHAATMARNITLGVIAAFIIGYTYLGFRIMNKPGNVDFLIATDSEMKKVNWTSRREIIGSTKVVIAFMFAIAALLFLTDIFFGYFFQFIKVLKYGPFD
jgi:preprotein translocase SecE subunit